MYSLTHLLTLIGLFDLQKKPQHYNIPHHWYKIQQNKTKQTPIIGQHDSHSWFCLFLYNRLTLTVLKPHSMALAQHNQHSCGTNKTLSQLTDPTYLPPSPPSLSFPFLVFLSTCNLQNKVPSIVTTIFFLFLSSLSFPITALFSNNMHDQQNLT